MWEVSWSYLGSFCEVAWELTPFIVLFLKEIKSKELLQLLREHLYVQSKSNLFNHTGEKVDFCLKL